MINKSEDVKIESWLSLPMTLREARDRAGAWLLAQGVEDGRDHAERLLLHVLGMDRAALLLAWHEPFPAEHKDTWAALIRRRATGEPLQYVIGEEWFYGRPFAVTPAVLIPRPETELLVEAVLEAAGRLWPPAAQRGAAKAPMVVDVGTGSGAIAVTLAAQRHDWRVCASDLSPDALEVARANAARHGVAGRMDFALGDLLAPFIGAGRGGTAVDGELAIDVLVSNPPYIPAADIPHLQREVRDFEPLLALEGGADGLTPYRRMLEALHRLPAMPRIVAFELGMGQPGIVAAWMRDAAIWDEVRIITDYNGIERHIIAVQSNQNSTL